MSLKIASTSERQSLRSQGFSKITPTRHATPQELPLLPINREKLANQYHSQDKLASSLPNSSLPIGLELIKALNVKLEPTNSKGTKNTKTGSHPIQGRSEQR